MVRKRRSRRDIERELDQLLTLIKEMPGLSISELAQHMQFTIQVVRSRLGRLEGAGKIDIHRPGDSRKLSVIAIESPPPQAGGGLGGKIRLEELAQQIKQFKRENPSVAVTFETRLRT